MTKFEIVLGDITHANVDAIVNAAKPSLAGGSGVDGAIHTASGPTVLQECLALELHDGVRCSVGEAIITSAGKLNSKFIIHTVGPVYKDSENPEALLRLSYINSMELALRYKCKSIAYPAISCGKYEYPHKEAINIAFSSLISYLNSGIKIYFYVLEADIYHKYNEILNFSELSI
jgi:O-acetyl-ADP-ribose deacetylase (regulator of RNase III)